MRRWKPQYTLRLWIGLALLILALAGAIAVGVRLGAVLVQPPEDWPVSLGLFAQVVALVALLLITGILAYRVASGMTLSYEIDRNGLYILWLGNRAVVPISVIESVDIGTADSRPNWGPIQGIGYYSGQGRTQAGQRLYLFATRPPSQCLLVHTANGSYAISPADMEGFVQDLEQRRNLGAVKAMSPTIESSRFFAYAFWNDHLVRWALTLALGLNLLLLGFLAARYPQLAETLGMRFNAAGNVVELGPRHQVLFLPLAAFMLSLLNTWIGMLLYPRDQAGARLLQFGSVLVQVLFAVAAIMITLR
ncbi:MAG: PH domain-containing protein [Chloroflexales bacterium]|nr:PH domain-containing protein [Chloroflexales bacterium]